MSVRSLILGWECSEWNLGEERWQEREGSMVGETCPCEIVPVRLEWVRNEGEACVESEVRDVRKVNER